MKSKEGWSLNVTKVGQRTHYYKDGFSLCGKAVVMPFMETFDKERKGSKYFKDCVTCIKKLDGTK